MFCFKCRRPKSAECRESFRGNRNNSEEPQQNFRGNQRNSEEFQEPYHDNQRNFGNQRQGNSFERQPFGHGQPPMPPQSTNEAQYPHGSRQGPPQQQVQLDPMKKAPLLNKYY